VGLKDCRVVEGFRDSLVRKVCRGSRVVVDFKALEVHRVVRAFKD
jgi:hypothetical protein